MTSTQFSMVEELASLVKNNLHSKHLILSVEELLVNFLGEDTSSNEVLELEPMNPYNRLLVHRLADIFGFSHQSVGEGEARHLVLERCPETSLPPILVSDLISPFEEMQSTMIFEEPRWNEVMPETKEHAVSRSSLKERETTYFAPREMIFSSAAGNTKLVKRPKHDAVVACRMITHALGQSNKLSKHEPSSSDAKDAARAAKGLKIQCMEREEICSRDKMGKNSIPRPCAAISKEGLPKDCLKKEQVDAAKRLFANALRMHPRDANLSNQTRKSSC